MNYENKIKDSLPNHLAFILDGNGRWATKRHLPRNYGHKKGVEVLEKIVDYCFFLGIKCVSLFAFSTENWKRPKEEVEAIFELLRGYIDKDSNEIKKEQEYKSRGIKLITMGDITKLPKDLFDAIERVKDDTKDCDKFILNIAINYGGRDDIIHACNQMLNSGLKTITEHDFKNYLYSKGTPELDFIIRTAGDLRLSNFMLYQCAYSELYFTKTLWPDFSKKELLKALINFKKRNRKFGAIKQ